MNRYQRRNRSIYHKRQQCTYTLFLVNLPYSINKAIRIHVFYCPWHQHCIIWVMDMPHNISSYVIKNVFLRFRTKIGCTSAVIFLWDIKKKNEKRLNYSIEEWHTSTLYNIFRNQSTYPTVCLLLDTWHRIDNCITVCGKWIFDSNFEVAFPLTQD